jgi:hypothetical protein
MRGIEIATIEVYPVRYIPAERSLIVHTQIEVMVVLEPLAPEIALERIERAPERLPYSLRASEIRWVRSTVRNPADFDRFYRGAGVPLAVDSTPFGGFDPPELPSTDGPPVTMVIITDNLSAEGANLGDVTGEFQRLADWKTQKGVPTVVRTVQSIRANYAGPDDPARIREFIKDAYKKWGTDWVLLGGDIDVVPGRRMIHVPSSYEIRPVLDSYYGGLDGDWDIDNDGRYGEILGNGSETDPLWEVWIGRAPIHNEIEAEVFVNKSLTYARAPGGSTAGLDQDYYTLYIGFCSEFGVGAWQFPQNLTSKSEAIAQRILPTTFDVLRMYRLYSSGGVYGCTDPPDSVTCGINGYYETWRNVQCRDPLPRLPNKHNW